MPPAATRFLLADTPRKYQPDPPNPLIRPDQEFIWKDQVDRVYFYTFMFTEQIRLFFSSSLAASQLLRSSEQHTCWHLAGSQRLPSCFWVGGRMHDGHTPSTSCRPLHAHEFALSMRWFRLGRQEICQLSSCQTSLSSAAKSVLHC